MSFAPRRSAALVALLASLSLGAPAAFAVGGEPGVVEAVGAPTNKPGTVVPVINIGATTATTTASTTQPTAALPVSAELPSTNVLPAVSAPVVETPIAAPTVSKPKVVKKAKKAKKVVKHKKAKKHSKKRSSKRSHRK
jgi:hypothetical protein